MRLMKSAMACRMRNGGVLRRRLSGLLELVTYRKVPVQYGLRHHHVHGSTLLASAVLCTLDRYVGDSGACSY